MTKIINIRDNLEKKVSTLENELQSVEENFDQTMASIELKRNNGKLTDSDIYKALEALKAHHIGEETITEEIIKTERNLGKYKEKSE